MVYYIYSNNLETMVDCSQQYKGGGPKFCVSGVERRVTSCRAKNRIIVRSNVMERSGIGE